MNEPKFKAHAFTCPHCGVLATMNWVSIKKDFSEDFKSEEAAISVCFNCNKPALWVNKELVYPDYKDVAPHKDMPEPAAKTFREAQSILTRSPRGSCMLLRLCLEQLLTWLGYDQKTLASKIIEVSKRNTQIESLLNVCRFAGNEFVHAGTLDSLDKSGLDPKGTAESLSTLINSAVEILITQPKIIADLNNRFSKH
ncbi:DUF4145 domain-containing protein [Mesosutterella sp. OilRF-GAM-744-9]|uniref:DUF4145 domain-containing protein n=1 Tax=Mesosutterella porci TaxID=2915351 RepID=A0ABS9MTD7_9BURK|nr:DUF4145 domain-containing protein [Mesosutterella sp. oilRF-744-WT-GAM-9]MCG5031888.1 DUF4145 domain-containing protein [Mesosutterella sp. oilRF-744-WT-GAM-9]